MRRLATIALPLLLLVAAGCCPAPMVVPGAQGPVLPAATADTAPGAPVAPSPAAASAG